MLSHIEIQAILKAQLDEAVKRHEKAKRDFWQVCGEVPSGLPATDGTLRIQNASRAQSAAMEGRLTALKRFNEYLLRGTVPEGIQNSEAARSSDSLRAKS